jgi:hypothetical protein
LLVTVTATNVLLSLAERMIPSRELFDATSPTGRPAGHQQRPSRY